MPILSFLKICTKLRPKNSTNLSALKLLATHRLKTSKLQLPFQKIYHFPIQKKSILSKGLNFVPISKKTDQFSVKRDVEKFLRRVRLKAFFTIKRMILTFRTKILSKQFRFESLNGLPQRASSHLQIFSSKKVATISTNLNSIVTPNFPIFLRKSGRH